MPADRERGKTSIICFFFFLSVLAAWHWKRKKKKKRVSMLEQNGKEGDREQSLALLGFCVCGGVCVTPH